MDARVRASVDTTQPYLHVVEWSAPVRRMQYPHGEVVDSHHDRVQLEEWAAMFAADNGGVARSCVIDNPFQEVG